MRILDRYLLRLMVLPVLIGLGVFVVIMLSETAIKLGDTLIGMRVPPRLIAQYFLYRVPRAMSWSLPVGILVGVAMTCAQIARNGEATAIRAGGTSLRRLWAPMIATGVLGAAASFAIEEFVVPTANQRGTEVFRRMTHSQPVMRPRSEQVFRDKEGRLFYIGYMDDETNRLERVMVLTEYPGAGLRVLTAAKWAERSGDSWLLREGVTLNFDENGEQTGEPKHFEAEKIQFWTALEDYYLDQRSDFEMTTRELRDRVSALEIGGLDAQRWQVRLQFKYSMPVACIVFVLVAAPLGIRYAHLGSFAGIVVSILIVFLYNGVRSWGLAFGLVWDLPPIFAAWAQNIIFGALGLWLVARGR